MHDKTTISSKLQILMLNDLLANKIIDKTLYEKAIIIINKKNEAKLSDNHPMKLTA